MKIFHILNKKDWEQVKDLNEYVPINLENEGFIHCSKKDQFVRIADIKFKGRRDLFLLEIDSNKVKSPIKFERTLGMKEKHPHVYGPIKINAITKVYKLVPDVNGFFTQPRKEDKLK